MISKHAAHWLKQTAHRVQQYRAWTQSFHVCLPDSPFPIFPSKFGSSSLFAMTKARNFGSSLTVLSCSSIMSPIDNAFRETVTSSCGRDVIEIESNTGLSRGFVSICWVIVRRLVSKESNLGLIFMIQISRFFNEGWKLYGKNKFTEAWMMIVLLLHMSNLHNYILLLPVYSPGEFFDDYS